MSDQPGASDDLEARIASHPHDALFRRTFSDPRHAEGELRTVLPPDLVAHLDFSTLRVLPGSYVDQALRQQESDLLYALRGHGQDMLLYLLFEHQSESHPRMPLCLLGYLVRIWERYGERHPRASAKLPPIVPLVLYHGRTSWTAPTRLRELLAADDLLWPALAPYTPDFGFRLDDLARLGPGALRGRPSLTALARLVLFLLQRARHSPDLVAEFGSFVDVINELLQSPRGQDDWKVLLRYTLYVAELSPERFRALLRGKVSQEAEEALMSTAERLLAEGEARGRAEGEARGRAEGEARGRLATLEKLLNLKFGPLPSEVEGRMKRATLQELDLWTERVLGATRLEDVLD